MVSGVVCMLTGTCVEHYHSDVACLYITRVRNTRVHVCVPMYVCVSLVTHVRTYICMWVC